MLVMVMSIVMCMISIMDAGSYATSTITATSRAVTSAVYVDAANKDQKTKSLTIPDKQDAHVADPPRNNTLPLSERGLLRCPTTLDFDARDPLVAPPDSNIDVIMCSESVARGNDARNADSDE